MSDRGTRTFFVAGSLMVTASLFGISGHIESAQLIACVTLGFLVGRAS